MWLQRTSAGLYTTIRKETDPEYVFNRDDFNSYFYANAKNGEYSAEGKSLLIKALDDRIGMSDQIDVYAPNSHMKHPQRPMILNWVDDGVKRSFRERLTEFLTKGEPLDKRRISSLEAIGRALSEQQGVDHEDTETLAKAAERAANDIGIHSEQIAYGLQMEARFII